MSRRIACYLSSHGFGHAVRSETVITAMALEKPDWQFFIISGSPPYLFRRALQLPNVHLRSQATDFGLVQTTPRVIDLNSSALKLRELVSGYSTIVEREEAFLKRESISAAFCDIPFLPFQAAHNLGIPAAGMGNFTWDWIYYYYRELDPAFEAAARLAYGCYKHCGLYLALPSSPEPAAFRKTEKIPLVCRKPSLSTRALRKELNLNPGHRIVLIGFSEANLDAKAVARIEKIPDTTFLLPEPLELHLENGIRIPSEKVSFHSLVGLADVIITKPGYGIISDAIASRKPLVTTERGDFPEIPYLDRLLEETVGQTRITMRQFNRGRWGKFLKKAKLRNFDFPVNGTRTASERLIRYFSLHSLP